MMHRETIGGNYEHHPASLYNHKGMEVYHRPYTDQYEYKSSALPDLTGKLINQKARI